MITLYSGLGGSGKSLSVCERIIELLKLGKNVITDMTITVEHIKSKEMGKLVLMDRDSITPSFLENFAYDNHKKGKEGQTYFVLDEAQLKFHPNVIKEISKTNSKFRIEWLDFFSQHRHLGYEVILICTKDKLLDAQVRLYLEQNYIHKCINNRGGILGDILCILRFKIFTRTKFWYGTNDYVSGEYFFLKKKILKCYDSYARFNKKNDDESAPGESEKAS